MQYNYPTSRYSQEVPGKNIFPQIFNSTRALPPTVEGRQTLSLTPVVAFDAIHAASPPLSWRSSDSHALWILRQIQRRDSYLLEDVAPVASRISTQEQNTGHERHRMAVVKEDMRIGAVPLEPLNVALSGNRHHLRALASTQVPPAMFASVHA